MDYDCARTTTKKIVHCDLLKREKLFQLHEVVKLTGQNQIMGVNYFWHCPTVSAIIWQVHRTLIRGLRLIIKFFLINLFNNYFGHKRKFVCILKIFAKKPSK